MRRFLHALRVVEMTEQGDARNDRTRGCSKWQRVDARNDRGWLLRDDRARGCSKWHGEERLSSRPKTRLISKKVQESFDDSKLSIIFAAEMSCFLTSTELYCGLGNLPSICNCNCSLNFALICWSSASVIILSLSLTLQRYKIPKIFNQKFPRFSIFGAVSAIKLACLAESWQKSTQLISTSLFPKNTANHHI